MRDRRAVDDDSGQRPPGTHAESRRLTNREAQVRPDQLWFLAGFLLLVAIVPVAAWLHERYGELVPSGLVAAAMLLDVARFRYGYEQLALANLVFVWGFCHQVGFTWDRLRVVPARFGHGLVLVGLLGLVGLTDMGSYPRSMVGTTSMVDRFSNMGPPTLSIVALCVLQVGLVVTFRERLEAGSQRPRVAISVRWLSANAMPLFLWHSVGFAALRAFLYLTSGVPDAPTSSRWLMHPLRVLGPLVLIVPLVAASRLIGRGAKPAGPVPPATQDTPMTSA